MSFALFHPFPPVTGQLVGAPCLMERARTLTHVVLAIPAAVADDLVFTLEINGTPTALVLTLAAGETLLNRLCGTAFSADDALAWRVTAAGDPAAGASGFALHAWADAADGTPGDWQLLFFGGPVVAGDTLFGRFVLPQAMTLQAVRATALAGGGTATVLPLFSDGSALSAVTLAAAASDTPQTVAATWSDALTAATALTFVATAGPTDPALGLTGVNVWLRLRPA